MQAPLVSVLVPCHNAERVVACSVRSILEQSVTDLEVVASDDCSTDRTPEVLQELACEDPRVRVLRSATRLGMTANWNRALEAARGKFVAKLDCDDMARSGFLDSLVRIHVARPAIIAAFCRTVTCDSVLEPVKSYLGDQALQKAGIDPLKLHVLGGHRWYEMCFDDIQLWHSNALMASREFLLSLKGWDERYGCASDTDLILRVLEHGGEVAHSPAVGIWYRTAEGSVSDGARAAGWLRWEGTLANVLSLQRAASSRIAFSRRLALQRRRYQANLEVLLSRDAGEIDTFPAEVASRLRKLISEVRRSSGLERARWALRCRVSSLAGSVRRILGKA